MDLERAIQRVDLRHLLRIREVGSLAPINSKITAPDTLDKPLVAYREVNPYLAVYSVSSRYILGRLIEKFNDDISFTQFACSVFKAQSPAISQEMLYTARCHRLLSRNGFAEPIDMGIKKLVSRKEDIPGDIKHYFYTWASGQETKDYIFHATARTPRYFSPDDDLGVLNKSTYYTLKGTNDPAYDAFVVHEGKLFIFRISPTSGRSRVVNVKRLEDLEKLVGNQVVGNWHFVNVVPCAKQEVAELVIPEEWASKLDVYTMGVSVTS
ncbi:hypothetical protein BDN72DRAFT_847494, partial [Pluteus cervinus]